MYIHIYTMPHSPITRTRLFGRDHASNGALDRCGMSMWVIFMFNIN